MRRSWLLALAVSVVGCAPDSPTLVTPGSPSGTLGGVVVSPRAAVVVLNGTQPLTVSAYSLDSTTTIAVPQVVYTSSDSTKVKVDAAGVIHAIATTPANAFVLVVATAQVGNVTRADTVRVGVAATQPTGVLSLSLQPDSTKVKPAGYADSVPKDSARLGIGGLMPTGVTGSSGTAKSLAGVVKATDGATVVTIPSFVELRATPGHATRVTLDRANRQITPLARDTLWIVGRATVFGEDLVDSVQYIFTDQAFDNIAIRKSGLNYESTDQNGPIYVAVNAVVRFQNGLASGGGEAAVTFAFSDSSGMTSTAAPAWLASAAAGNVTNLAASGYGHRKFTTPGTYTWTANTPVPVTGQIIVR